MAKPYFTAEGDFTNPPGFISLKKTVTFVTVFFMAPLVGLEPTTCGLTVRRSTD